MTKKRSRKSDIKVLHALSAEYEAEQKKKALHPGMSFEDYVTFEYSIEPPMEVCRYLKLQPGDKVRFTLTLDGVLMTSENFIPSQAPTEEVMASADKVMRKRRGVLRALAKPTQVPDEIRKPALARRSLLKRLSKQPSLNLGHWTRNELYG